MRISWGPQEERNSLKSVGTAGECDVGFLAWLSIQEKLPERGNPPANFQQCKFENPYGLFVILVTLMQI